MTDVHVDRVSIKVPPFWAEDPVLWFAQIERQFGCAGITQDASKFDIVTGALERRFATAVRELILNPPAVGKYDELKRQLIRRFSPSLDQRLQQLFQHEEMGDRSPSQFLEHMRILGGPDVSDNMLRVLWLGRMPQQMSYVLTASPPGDLEALAVIADRIHEREIPTSRVASVETPSTLPSCQEQLNELVQQVAALSAGRSTATHGERSRNNQQQATSSAVRNTDDDGMCWFHRTFGEWAKQCRKPCNFRSKNLSGRQ
jgi:hypothetical protein